MMSLFTRNRSKDKTVPSHRMLFYCSVSLSEGHPPHTKILPLYFLNFSGGSQVVSSVGFSQYCSTLILILGLSMCQCVTKGHRKLLDLREGSCLSLQRCTWMLRM